MRYLSVCSGIEAATVAWHPLGWEPAAFSEIEAFPRAVLKHHYPDVPLHGDFTTIRGDEYGPIDLLVGGTPCQSFSVAGLRGGMADDRGNLALEYIRLADRKRPRWLVWENVPGVFSSSGGDDFRCFLSGLVRWSVPIPDGGWKNAGVIAAGPADGAYGVAWRVLDAQFAGVPQRRRRVFVVGHLGDWRRAAAVLFERHSLSGHPAPRREAGQAVAGTLKSCSGKSGAPNGAEEADRLIPQGYGGETAPTLNAAYGSKLGLDNQHIDSGAGLFVAHSLRAEGFDASEDGTGRGTPLVPVAIQAGALRENPDSGPDGAGVRIDGQAYTLEARAEVQAACFTAKDHGADASDISPTLRSGSHSGSHANGGVMPAVAYGIRSDASRDGEAKTPSADAEGRVRLRRPGMGVYEEIAPTVDASQPHTVATSAVRRLTPRECERLQGCPDDYTAVPYRGKPAADGPRYKAVGNSMAVPVMRWIGERIAKVEALPASIAEAA
jgi:DNA (cytosine-5)-methyltransferase 1